MSKEGYCKRLTDCSQCTKVSEGVLVYRRMSKGHYFPSNKCTQNCMIFVREGELLINSEEYPGTTLHIGEFILQAIGSKLELLALTDVEYVVYLFNELPQICEPHYNKMLENLEPPLTYTPLNTIPCLNNFLNNIQCYLMEQPPCYKFIEIKCKELVYILTCYYPIPQLGIFFYPIAKYTKSFHHFIMQNYSKVKNVEEFAHLGGYSINTFRRLFKNMYGEPVYEWILKKKRECILYDLQHTKLKITEISNCYGFDSLSNFAHFCKSSFGYSPRTLRSHVAKEKTTPPENENI